MEDIGYLGSLISRFFLITQFQNAMKWGGCSERSEGESDYDSLEKYISYQDGDLTLFSNSRNELFYIFFSMASKVEIFKKNNGFIFCDGLFFNKSIYPFTSFNLDIMEDMGFEMEVKDYSLIIFDAAMDGSLINKDDTEGCHKIGNDWFNSYAIINLVNGFYSIKKVRITIVIDNKDVVFMGIEVSTQS
jgi:hypothetical protein